MKSKTPSQSDRSARVSVTIRAISASPLRTVIVSVREPLVIEVEGCATALALRVRRAAGQELARTLAADEDPEQLWQLRVDSKTRFDFMGGETLVVESTDDDPMSDPEPRWTQVATVPVLRADSHALGMLCAIAAAALAVGYHQALLRQPREGEELVLAWPDYVVFVSAVVMLALAAVSPQRRGVGWHPRPSLVALGLATAIAFAALRAPLWVEYRDGRVALSDSQTLDSHTQRLWPWQSMLRSEWLRQRDLRARAEAPALCGLRHEVPDGAWPVVRRVSLEDSRRFRALSQSTLDQLHIDRTDTVCDPERSTASRCCVDLGADRGEQRRVIGYRTGARLTLGPGALIDLEAEQDTRWMRVGTAPELRMRTVRSSIAPAAEIEWRPTSALEERLTNRGAQPTAAREQVFAPAAPSRRVTIELETGERLPAWWAADERSPSMFVARVDPPLFESFSGWWSASRAAARSSLMVFSRHGRPSRDNLAYAQMERSQVDRWHQLGPVGLGPVPGFVLKLDGANIAVVACPDVDSTLVVARPEARLGTIQRLTLVRTDHLPTLAWAHAAGAQSAPMPERQARTVFLCVSNLSTVLGEESFAQRATVAHDNSHYIALLADGRGVHVLPVQTTGGIELREVDEPLPAPPQCCVIEGSDELIECSILMASRRESHLEPVANRTHPDCAGVFRQVIHASSGVEGMTSTRAD